MRKSIDYYLPKWICDKISQRVCSCGSTFGKKDLTQLGIRKNKSREVLAVELCCSVCGRGIIITYPTDYDFRKLLCVLLKEIQKKDELKKSMLQEKYNFGSKISDNEVNEFKIKLKKMDNYNELLKELGIETDEDEIK